MDVNKIHLGDCLEVLKGFPDNSIDSVVTDPPYGISFMNKKWDYDVPSVQIWKEVLRVLKPGGHALVACGTRTQHRMAIGLEDAGFEIRDTIEYLYDANVLFQQFCEALPSELLKLLVMSLGNDCIATWAYGTGFPKSLDVGKAIDKEAGVEREVIGIQKMGERSSTGVLTNESCGLTKTEVEITVPATEDAKQWDAWGTALKPAIELWTLCRKPLAEATVAANVLKYGTGGLNVEKCRIQTTDSLDGGAYCKSSKKDMSNRRTITLAATGKVFEQPIGRFPSNLIHDGSAEVLALFPETTSGELSPDHKQTTGWFSKDREGAILRNYGGDSGSAARFFYCAKASKTERGKGNIHTTVKPVQLMNYLVTLITPPDGIVLDPFTGSGSTLVAAKAKGFKYIGMEREPEYHTIAEKRVDETAIEKDCLEALGSLNSLEEIASNIPAPLVVDLLDMMAELDE